ncbi:hypothetical protein [Pseudonocardia sp. KRD291]|nr:hypothetical protein [Pseudonocardia sp. KRD291]MBW0102175.1 hypothetical protein [Pseudonocardia sp. KRD291]
MASSKMAAPLDDAEHAAVNIEVAVAGWMPAAGSTLWRERKCRVCW